MYCMFKKISKKKLLKHPFSFRITKTKMKYLIRELNERKRRNERFNIRFQFEIRFNFNIPIKISNYK